MSHPKPYVIYSMCGIVAYIGPKSIDSVLLVGLIRLEYRGYDSAGMAVLHRGELQIRKGKGKIKNLEEKLQAHPIEGNIGIGHTRWATHGEANHSNAHPHTDTENHIAVAHNGIIENHYALRRELSNDGHVFHSETDTEVIPHLIEDKMKKGYDIQEALYRTISCLEGRYAFVLIYDGQPDCIFFAKDGSPLIFAKGKKDAFLASDVPAVLPIAKSYYVINDGAWGWVQRDGSMKLFNKKHEALPYTLANIDLSVKDVEKNSYEHFMLKEIFEQPGIMRKIIKSRLVQKGHVHFPEKISNNHFLGRLSRILITSAGSSWHASLTGKMYLEQLTKIATEVDISSEFRYRNPIAGGDTKVIALSQSGETADTIASIYEAKAKFLRVLSFVNSKNSTIARESDTYIDLMAGPEIGVASTKAYTAQILHLLLYAIFLASIRWVLDKEERKQLFDEIRKLPEQMEEILSQSEIIKNWAADFKNTKDFVFLGRSWNYATALEGALKLKEISYIHASGYAGGEFKHGPIALITNEVPVLCIATQSETYEKMLSNIEEVKARKGPIVALYTKGDEIVPKKADYSFPIPKCLPLLSPILNVLPLQLFAYYVARERGCEPDQPRNLAKSVTVE